LSYEYRVYFFLIMINNVISYFFCKNKTRGS
jgi:hypothetical protein